MYTLSLLPVVPDEERQYAVWVHVQHTAPYIHRYHHYFMIHYTIRFRQMKEISLFYYQNIVSFYFVDFWRQGGYTVKRNGGMDMEYRIGCLIMAAGNARRFAANKLAATLDGKSLISRTLEAVPQEQFTSVTVVTQYPEVARLAEEFGFASIFNRHPDWGISHTILLGTQAMADCDAILYLVSDQPLLRQDSITRVVKAWRSTPDFIVGASHHGKRGNPCIFPRRFFPELMQLQEDCGGNQVIRAHPQSLKLVEIPQQELTDVDTPRALEELKKQEKAK